MMENKILDKKTTHGRVLAVSTDIVTMKVCTDKDRKFFEIRAFDATAFNGFGLAIGDYVSIVVTTYRGRMIVEYDTTNLDKDMLDELFAPREEQDYMSAVMELGIQDLNETKHEPFGDEFWDKVKDSDFFNPLPSEDENGNQIRRNHISHDLGKEGTDGIITNVDKTVYSAPIKPLEVRICLSHEFTEKFGINYSLKNPDKLYMFSIKTKRHPRIYPFINDMWCKLRLRKFMKSLNETHVVLKDCNGNKYNALKEAPNCYGSDAIHWAREYRKTNPLGMDGYAAEPYSANEVYPLHKTHPDHDTYYKYFELYDLVRTFGLFLKEGAILGEFSEDEKYIIDYGFINPKKQKSDAILDINGVLTIPQQ
jgi:hypothetical protein